MYDVAVIGIGSMGSATSYYLAKQGIKVLGIDQFNPPHDFGSHTGESRIIRKAYFEHPDYVPLLEKSYKNWRDIELESGMKLFHKTGLLYIGDSEDFLLEGVRVSSKKYDIEIQKEEVSTSPAFSNLESKQLLFETEAGYVLPELTIQTYIDRAIQQGAEFQFGEKIIHWEKQEDGYLLVTNKHQYLCKKMVFTAGAYVKDLLPDLSVPLTVTKQSLFWFEAKHSRLFEEEVFPCWVHSDVKWPSIFYGFPAIYNEEHKVPLVKIAHHTTGVEVPEPDGEQDIPLIDQKNVKQFVDRFFKGSFRSCKQMKTCYYTMSEDENFIVDFLHGHNQNVVIGTGFSGHGFKFVPILGEVLSDLIIHGRTDIPIKFLSLSRF